MQPWHRLSSQNTGRSCHLSEGGTGLAAYLGEAVSQLVFTEGTTEVRRTAGDVPVGVPVFLTGRAATLEEILRGQNLLSSLPAVRVVEMTVVVVNLLIGEYCLDGVNYSQLPVVSPGGVGTTGMIGQTKNINFIKFLTTKCVFIIYLMVGYTAPPSSTFWQSMRLWPLLMNSLIS